MKKIFIGGNLMLKFFWKFDIFFRKKKCCKTSLILFGKELCEHKCLRAWKLKTNISQIFAKYITFDVFHFIDENSGFKRKKNVWI